MSNIFEEIDYLSITILPLAYAQLTRLISLFFLLLLPFSANIDMG